MNSQPSHNRFWNRQKSGNGFLFSCQGGLSYPWLEYVWVTLLYLLGAALWGQFFNWGNIPFDFHDWAEINAPRLAFVRDAVLKWVLPLHMPDASALRNLTDRFMALPDVFLSPQALLFHFLEVGPFVLVNTLLLYTLGVWGLLWFRRRFSLSPLVFAFLFFLYNFNGHILAHMSIGHVTWGGYFLYPWYFALLFRLLEGDRRWRWSAEMGLLLFVIFLQGSFHQFVWGLMFLGLLAIAAWRHWLPALRALVLACMFSMVRFLPPVLLLGRFDTDFYGGYRWPQYVLQALVKQVTPAESMPFMNFSSNLGYWEFDLYIGWAGVIFVALGLFLWLRSQVQLRRYSPFLLPMAVFLLLSIRDVYLPITYIPIPLLNGERVTSRMLIVPFTLSMILSAASIQTWVNQKRLSPAVRAAGLGLLGYLVFDLARRAMQWQVLEAVKVFPNTPVNLAIKVVANHADAAYIQMLAIGAGLSLASMVIAAVLVWREKR